MSEVVDDLLKAVAVYNILPGPLLGLARERVSHDLRGAQKRVRKSEIAAEGTKSSNANNRSSGERPVDSANRNTSEVLSFEQ